VTSAIVRQANTKHVRRNALSINNCVRDGAWVTSPGRAANTAAGFATKRGAPEVVDIPKILSALRQLEEMFCTAAVALATTLLGSGI
jgi:hypothetical protein